MGLVDVRTRTDCIPAPPVTMQAMNEEQTGPRHPVLAIAAFVGVFALTGLACVLDSENPLVVAPFFMAALCCAILFLRLLLGEMRWARWIWLGLGLPLCLAAGDEWYLVVLLMGGTYLGTLLVARLIGNFEPLVVVAPSPDHGRESGD